MPVVDSSEALLELLAESKLLTPERMGEVRATYASEPDPRKVARRLARHGWITRWQAEQLMAGRNSFLFGDYMLLSLIGKGNMGAVFEARHKDNPRPVALKIMAKEILKDAVKIARFQREMSTVARLSHPNIVAFYDSGKEGSTNFLAMECVAGRDLRDLLRDHKQLPIDFACECIRQAALGLQHAHEQGLVHRDVKPDNLLVQLDAQGRPLVKILDLGLARLSSEEQAEEAGLTRPGQLVGTPNYVAPELVVNPDHVDIRADIYSLGCTLFRLITGKLPIVGETAMEKLVNRVKSDAPSILEFRADVPPDLATVIARMLARVPATRYQKPQMVADALYPFCWKPGDPPPAVNVFRQPPDEDFISQEDSETSLRTPSPLPAAPVVPPPLPQPARSMAGPPPLVTPGSLPIPPAAPVAAATNFPPPAPLPSAANLLAQAAGTSPTASKPIIAPPPPLVPLTRPSGLPALPSRPNGPTGSVPMAGIPAAGTPAPPPNTIVAKVPAAAPLNQAAPVRPATPIPIAKKPAQENAEGMPVIATGPKRRRVGFLEGIVQAVTRMFSRR